MAGALNKLPVAISGMIFFDAPVTFFSVTAIFIGPPHPPSVANP
jgi:GDP-mannose transporter